MVGAPQLRRRQGRRTAPGSNAYAGALPPAGNGNSPGDQFALAGPGKSAVNSVNP